MFSQSKLSEGQKEFCELEPEEGDCRAAMRTYFYNPKSRDCEEFIYGGCGGNANNFDTYLSCMTTCRDPKEICGLKPETGLCEASMPKYFYNPGSQGCEMFTYGGCGGNANNFDTHSDCMSTCSDVKTSYKDVTCKGMLGPGTCGRQVN